MYEQLLCHLAGDFVLQNDYMALNKSKRSFPCLVHVIIYTSVFLFLTTSWKALLVIGITHFLIDRFHTPLKRFIWLKNKLGAENKSLSFDYCNTTGFYDDSPYNKEVPDCVVKRIFGEPRLFFITAWLYIVHDNFLHLLINYLALKYLT